MIEAVEFAPRQTPIEAERGEFRVIPKTLPIGHLLDYVSRRANIPQEELIRTAASDFSDPHERWEAVRHGRANLVVGEPIKANVLGRIIDLSHTGWEGFYAGLGLSPVEIVRDQAEIGGRSAHSLELMAPLTYSRMVHIFDTGRNYSLDALRAIEDCFRTIKARFDGGYYSEAVEVFRRQTAELVKRMPAIEMEREGEAVVQRLPLPYYGISTPASPIEITLSFREYQGYKLMEHVGRVGQPLIREMLAVSN